MSDASHALAPELHVSACASSRSSILAATAIERPPVPSSAINRPFAVPFCASLARDLRMVVQPLHQHFLVPLRPRPPRSVAVQAANQPVLIEDRLLRVHLHELEDHRQRFVLLNHAPDELRVTLQRILDLRDILAGLVIIGRAFAAMRFPDVSGDTEK